MFKQRVHFLLHYGVAFAFSVVHTKCSEHCSGLQKREAMRGGLFCSVSHTITWILACFPSLCSCHPDSQASWFQLFVWNRSKHYWRLRITSWMDAVFSVALYSEAVVRISLCTSTIPHKSEFMTWEVSEQCRSIEDIDPVTSQALFAILVPFEWQTNRYLWLMTVDMTSHDTITSIKKWWEIQLNGEPCRKRRRIKTHTPEIA